MWPSFPSRGHGKKQQRGFTVPEALITLVILVIILVAGAQLLFRTRESAERQRAQVEARQTARAATEYVHFLLRGATDMNGRSEAYPAPALLLVWLERTTGGGATVQFTYDNVTNPNFADVGTDIITFARAEQRISVAADCWPGGQNAVNLCLRFTQGCPDSANNLALFKQLTGARVVGNREVSDVLMLMGSNGNWAFLQITDYKDNQNDDNCNQCRNTSSQCAWAGGGAAPPGIWVIANPGLSDKWNYPGCCPTLQNPEVALGVRYVTLRVKNRALQQKNGVFDTDNPDDGFFTVMPNVEDFQIAYFFRDGSVRNNTVPQNCGWAPNCVPVQNQAFGDPGTLPENHAANVIGLRVTITARSASPLPPTQEPTARFRQPIAENHDPQAAPDRFYHYQNSVFVLLRNRTPRA